MSVFEVLDTEQWNESGAGALAEKGEYGRILSDFRDSGSKYAVIPTNRGKFAGRKASTVGTALKNARDGKNAPENVETIQIRSKGDSVYLHNTSIEA